MSNVKNLVIAALVAVIAIGGGAFAFAQSAQRTADVELRVWRSTSDHTAIYWSARPAGGSWRELGTHRVGFKETSTNGRWGFTDIDVSVPLPDAPTPAPTPTASPTPTPDNNDLAHLWVYLRNRGDDTVGAATIYFSDAKPAHIPFGGLEVVVSSGRRSAELCNPTIMRRGIALDLSCSPLSDTHHTAVVSVYAIVSSIVIDGERHRVTQTYTCERHSSSDSRESVFACDAD